MARALYIYVMINGSNGKGPEGRDEDKKEKILHFPSLAERDRIRKEQQARENAWREEYKTRNKTAAVPFFNFGNIPPFTGFMSAAFVLVHFAMLLAGPSLETKIIYMFAFVPGYFTGAMGEFPLAALLGPFTHVFFHGGWMHLTFNTVMMLALGTFFERIFGTPRTIFFFFACALAGAAVHFALNPASTVPIIGASGGLSGLFGAMIILLNAGGEMGFPGRRGPWPLIGFWLLFMIGTGMISGGSLAWAAHVGGFLAGIGLLYLMRSRRI